MDAMANPPQHANALWELAKLKNGKPKLQNNPVSLSSTNPGSRSLKG
jgi:hypothetical protein